MVVLVAVATIGAAAKGVAVKLVVLLFGGLCLFGFQQLALGLRFVFAYLFRLLQVNGRGVDVPRLAHVPVAANLDALWQVENVLGLNVLGVVARVPTAVAVAVVYQTHVVGLGCHISEYGRATANNRRGAHDAFAAVKQLHNGTVAGTQAAHVDAQRPVLALVLHLEFASHLVARRAVGARHGKAVEHQSVGAVGL